MSLQIERGEITAIASVVAGTLGCPVLAATTMIEAPEVLFETTAAAHRGAVGGVLGETLRLLRIRGTLLLREMHRPPFRVVVPSADELEAYLGAPAGSRAVAFHLAEIGRFELSSDGGEPLMVETGEMVVACGGRAHTLGSGRAEHTVGFAELLDRGTGPLIGPTERRDDADVNGDASTRILCGALIFSNARLNPLFGALPDLLPIRSAETPGAARIDQLVASALAEIGRRDVANEYFVERWLEMLCAEGIRAYATRHTHAVGWFRGLADSVLARAFRAFHDAPGEPWSVARLAAAAHLSPSRFSARFAELTGTSVMSYVTGWRMHLAILGLVEDDRSVAELAASLGYSSQAAFSRAFKRVVGVAPAAYRDRHST